MPDDFAEGAVSVTSAKSARAQGLAHYFTGRPCKRGHMTLRQTNDRKCTECSRITARLAQPIKRKEFLGRVITTYAEIRRRVEGRGCRGDMHIYKGLGLMPRGEFLAWAAADPAYQQLHRAWVRSAYARKLMPSIDRIDTQRGYIRGNVQWLSTSEHAIKTAQWKYYGINQITKEAA